jgi:predicted DNA-binding protein
MQEAIERKRLREMDDAFCAALAAAIRRGKEKGPSAKQT